MKIGIVDYGMGNISSISTTLNYIGINDICISSEFENLINADKLILPGVGSFAIAMKNIKDKKIDVYLNEIVVCKKKPILGICLGMQLLAKSSDEDGNNTGLGYIDSVVSKFKNVNLKIPHVGFNQVEVCKKSKLFYKINDNPDFYFTHSYRMISDKNINQSYCNYGEKFIASFEFNNVFGTQFHPELSQFNGIQLLTNFINLT
jgi:glutamine amidotransferase